MSRSAIGETLNLLRNWAEDVKVKLDAVGIYVFGSLVYRNGEQFNDASDIDIVVIIPVSRDNAIARTTWLQQLAELKQGLEAELAKLLDRVDPDKLICSIIAPTQFEIAADIHKTAPQGFFKVNQFLDLLSGTTLAGLHGAGGQKIEDERVADCARFAQGKRNAFLGVTASGKQLGLPAFAETDPLPKDIMRHGAMAEYLCSEAPDAAAQFDLQAGLDFLSHTLYKHRNENDIYKDLNNRLSVRRGSKGHVKPLQSIDQLFLAEVIYDIALEHIKVVARKEASANSKPALQRAATVFFYERFSQAFPGVRGCVWYTNPSDIKIRLEKLLHRPLVYSDGTPIWWWRGSSNLQIERFDYIDDGVFLMDVTELKIRRIAAANPGTYKYCFIYVELEPMAPTELYKDAQTRIAEVKSGDSYFPYSWEEYGIVDQKYLVNRAQFDDGAAEIEGELQDIRERAKLRVRYITPYNFLIAAANSPINNVNFEDPLEQMLDQMLNGEDQIEEIAESVRRLPAKDF